MPLKQHFLSSNNGVRINPISPYRSLVSLILRQNQRWEVGKMVEEILWE